VLADAKNLSREGNQLPIAGFLFLAGQFHLDALGGLVQLPAQMTERKGLFAVLAETFVLRFRGTILLPR
jgi:hypothetical protein